VLLDRRPAPGGRSDPVMGWHWIRLAGRLVPLVAAAVALGSRPVSAQAKASGTLEGIVVDADSGTSLPGTTVLVLGTLLRAETGSDGRFVIVGVSPGAYAIQALRIGYKSATVTDIAVGSGQSQTVELRMARAVAELGGVVVTADRGESRAQDVSASIETMSHTELINRDAYRLDQALGFVPGVVFNDGDIDIRGSTGVTEGVGSRVLILLDGHPVLSADGAETDFKAIPLLDVDHVEVVKGPYSALYGGNALGGVVNVITTPVSPQPQTFFEVHYGTYDTPPEFRFTGEGLTDKGVEVQHSRQIGDVGARLVIGREESTGFRQDDGQDQWLFRTKLMYPADAAHPSMLYAVWSNERSGNFFGWQNPSQPYATDPHDVRDYQWYDKVSVGSNIVAFANQSTLVQVQPYLDYNNSRNHFYQSDTTAFQSLNPITAADSATDRVLAQSDTINRAFHRAAKYGMSGQVSLTPGARQSVVVGGDESATSIQADALAPVPELHDWGAYAQDQIGVGPAIKATAGARVDSHTSVGGAETVFSPKLGLVYRLSDALDIRISGSRGYRAPSAIEQFVDQYQQGVHVVPNPALHGETAWSEEIGATEDLGRLWFDAAVFESDYQNLIEPEVAKGSVTFSTFQFQNVTDARIRGLDAGTKVAVVPGRVGLSLSYLYLDTQDLTPHSPLYDTPLPYRSKHEGTASLDLFGGLMGADVQYRSRIERVEVYETDPRTPITLVDLRMGYRVRGVILQAKASNIFQARYVDVLERIPGAPRSILFTALKEL
jgi:outer membrane receptor for ferrienterochelin and colicins